MAETDPTAINLDDGERAVLGRVVELSAPDVNMTISQASNADELEAALERAQVQADLLRASENGALAPNAAVAASLRKYRQDSLDFIASQRDALSRLRQGDLDCCPVGYSPEEGERVTLEGIAEELRGVGPLDRMLERLAITA
jgi:hypothetical protein